MLSVFISSPANEFKEERIKIKKFIEENSILNQILRKKELKLKNSLKKIQY